MPFAGFSSDPYSFGPGNGACQVVAFYRSFNFPPETREQRAGLVPRPPVDKTPRFIARVLSSNTRASGEWTERWADQTSCPAMEPALTMLSGVLTLKFTGEGLGRILAGLPLDSGNHYALWARDTFYPTDLDYDRYNLEVSTNTGSAVGEWIDQTLAALAPCLMSTRPAEWPT